MCEPMHKSFCVWTWAYSHVSYMVHGAGPSTSHSFGPTGSSLTSGLPSGHPHTLLTLVLESWCPLSLPQYCRGPCM